MLISNGSVAGHPTKVSPIASRPSSRLGQAIGGAMAASNRFASTVHLDNIGRLAIEFAAAHHCRCVATGFRYSAAAHAAASDTVRIETARSLFGHTSCTCSDGPKSLAC